jgi:hypothetical protein
MAYGGNFGATQNSLTIEVDFKKSEDADYDPQGTETYTLALSQSGFNDYTDNLTFLYTLDYQYQYDIRFTVSDLFSTAVYTAQLMQGLPIISWDENEVDIWGDLHIHDRTTPTDFVNVRDLIVDPLTKAVFTTSSVSVPANDATSTSVSLTVPAGYKPFAVTSTWTNGAVILSNCNTPIADNTTSVTIWLRNVTSSSMSVTASVEVLFIKA